MGRARNTHPAAAHERRIGDAARREGLRWTAEWLQAELAAFVGERPDWPAVDEFHAAGRVDLYRAVLRHGGCEHWASVLGVERQPTGGAVAAGRARNPRRWTEERIFADLQRVLAGRQDWPKVAEFRAAGAMRLYKAVIQHGGIPYWAERMGFRLGIGQGDKRYLHEDAARDATAVVARCGYVPNAKKLRELGFRALANFLDHNGGYKRFCEQHGLLSAPPE